MTSEQPSESVTPQFESQIMMEMLNAMTLMFDALSNAVVVSDHNQRIIKSQVVKCAEMLETLYVARKMKP